MCRDRDKGMVAASAYQGEKRAFVICNVKASTEELLYALFRLADTLVHPTLSNLTDSFEGWADRRGLLRRLHDLERRQLLERWPQGSRRGSYRVTRVGCLRALGGTDPVRRWERAWDGLWRLVVFDVPEKENAKRAQLRRMLRDRRWGCLQRSVWVSPDPIDEAIERWERRYPVKVFISLETHAGTEGTRQALVKSAWDFELINRAYRHCLELLEQRPQPDNHESRTKSALLEWIRRDGNAWRHALSLDPLLPGTLLPDSYLGRTAWRERTAINSGSDKADEGTAGCVSARDGRPIG